MALIGFGKLYCGEHIIFMSCQIFNFRHIFSPMPLGMIFPSPKPRLVDGNKKPPTSGQNSLIGGTHANGIG
jgi:hypothetical protein